MWVGLVVVAPTVDNGTVVGDDDGALMMGAASLLERPSVEAALLVFEERVVTGMMGDNEK